ncbi:MAG TPA: hypothetical protein VD884_20930 [Ohtaekwangia sp.]|nr:hypothetical protein [Ohtaekwangia sp.]
MRLGQLARKLSVHTSDIVAYLAKENIQIEDGTNTRITPEQESLVIGHFAPDMVLQSKAEAEKIAEEDIPSEAPVHQIDELIEPAREVMTEEKKTPLEAEFEEEGPSSQGGEDTTKEIEVIKAPKVELKGLKVIGKIELPAPKKKDTPVDLPLETAAIPEEKKEYPVEKRKRNPQRTKNTNGPRKNPVALKREKEAQEAEEKRRAEAQRKKEARTEYYYKRVKPAAPTKAARIINEPTVEESDYMEEKPKTWFGKLMRWLTT